MVKNKKSVINVQGASIGILTKEKADFISITDMVKNFEGGSALIEQWLRNKDTVLFLGIWEKLNNPDFNSLEFEGIKNEVGRNSFFLSTKRWIEVTRARGLVASAGRYGGTYAHKDIAFEFGSWLSPEFKLYLIREFQRLKEEESRQFSLEWSLNRTLSKLNYRIHTDAIKEHIIPAVINTKQTEEIYASEADVLNVALFGKTAKQWRDTNPSLDGNMRDFATIEQLLVLANIESMNAELIRLGESQAERLKKLNGMAIQQLRSVLKHKHALKFLS
ncbi:MAG TPA: KilA-N domain-containing protein [Gammaproteobacteria bacterium]|nr:KilA-N domain-containing protein [Gammaproteobacteria bacterium]